MTHLGGHLLQRRGGAMLDGNILVLGGWIVHLRTVIGILRLLLT